MQRQFADKFLAALYEIGRQPFVAPHRGRVLEFLRHFDPQEILNAYREVAEHCPNRSMLITSFADGGRAVMLARRKRLNYAPIPSIEPMGQEI